MERSEGWGRRRLVCDGRVGDDAAWERTLRREALHTARARPMLGRGRYVSGIELQQGHNNSVMAVSER